MNYDRIEYNLCRIQGDIKEILNEVYKMKKELDDWKENVKYLLDTTPGAVRSCYKGLDENLLESLIINYIALLDKVHPTFDR